MKEIILEEIHIDKYGDLRYNKFEEIMINDKIPTAKEFLNNEKKYKTTSQFMIEFAKLHVKAALEAVIKEGKISIDVFNTETNILQGGLLSINPSYPPKKTTDSPFYINTKINEASILDAYPESNIK